MEISVFLDIIPQPSSLEPDGWLPGAPTEELVWRNISPRDAEGKLGSAMTLGCCRALHPCWPGGDRQLVSPSPGLGSLLQKGAKKPEENRAISGRQNSSFAAISTPPGTLWDLGGSVWLFLTSPWQIFVFQCWQAAAPGSFGVMDAPRCGVISLPALAPFSVCFPPLWMGGGRRGMNFLPWKF